MGNQRVLVVRGIPILETGFRNRVLETGFGSEIARFRNHNGFRNRILETITVNRVGLKAQLLPCTRPFIMYPNSTFEGHLEEVR